MRPIEKIRRFCPCDPAKRWLSTYAEGQEQQAWEECKRPDWMLWLIGRTNGSSAWSDARKPLVLCALDIASQVSHLWSKATAANVATIYEWARGTATVDAVQRARLDLRASARRLRRRRYAAAAASAAASAAAYAAAAYAAAAYAYAAATAAAYAAAAYASAAATAAAADAAASCNIIRKYYPTSPIL